MLYQQHNSGGQRWKWEQAPLVHEQLQMIELESNMEHNFPTQIEQNKHHSQIHL